MYIINIIIIFFSLRKTRTSSTSEFFISNYRAMYDYIDTNKYNIIVDCKLTFVAGIIYINDIFIIQPSICLPKEF